MYKVKLNTIEVLCDSAEEALQLDRLFRRAKVVSAKATAAKPKKKRAAQFNRWTSEEDALVTSHLDRPLNELVPLIDRHTRKAVTARRWKFKKERERQAREYSIA